MGVRELHEHLQSLARAEAEPISYTEAGYFVDLTMDNPDHRAKIGQILDDINRVELEAERPLLSALVVQEGVGTPGRGFFTLARALKLFEGRRSDDEIFFYADELQRVYAYWKTH